MEIVIFIVISTLTAFLVRVLGVYLMPTKKGNREKHNIFREMTRVLIASFAAWATYIVAPEERSFTLAVIIGSFVGTFLSFSGQD